MHTSKEQLSRGLTKNTKPYKGPPMEGMIARWYDKNRRSTSDQERLSRKARETLPKGGNVLEVAPGPGYLAIDLAKSGIYQVVGLDISKTFVEIARAHAEDASVVVDFRLGPVARRIVSIAEFATAQQIGFCGWIRAAKTFC